MFWNVKGFFAAQSINMYLVNLSKFKCITEIDLFNSAVVLTSNNHLKDISLEQPKFFHKKQPYKISNL